MNESKDVVKIVLHYEDGTSKEIDKGFIATIAENTETDTATVTFDMVHVGSKDLYTIVESIIELGFKLGMFNDTESVGDDL